MQKPKSDGTPLAMSFHVAGIIATIESPMILQEQTLRPGTVLHNFVHALAKFRMLVRQKLCSHTIIPCLPCCSAVIGAVCARRGDSNHHAPGICRIRHDRMQTHTSATWYPFRTVRMIEQPFYGRPCLP